MSFESHGLIELRLASTLFNTLRIRGRSKSTLWDYDLRLENSL